MDVNDFAFFLERRNKEKRNKEIQFLNIQWISNPVNI